MKSLICIIFNSNGDFRKLYAGWIGEICDAVISPIFIQNLMKNYPTGGLNKMAR